MISEILEMSEWYNLVHALLREKPDLSFVMKGSAVLDLEIHDRAGETSCIRVFGGYIAAKYVLRVVHPFLLKSGNERQQSR